MAQQKVDFRKVRDFGENINDSFLFIRQNLKPLLRSFFAICAIFMLSQAVINGLYQSRFKSVFTDIFNQRDPENNNVFSQIFTFEYFLVILLTLITFAAMQVAVGAYVKYYVENDGEQPGIEEVWAIFKKYFFRILIYNLPTGVIMIVGILLCVIPGIYFWVVFVPFTMIAMIENTGFSATFQRCFDLIRGNFWITFGIYIVAYLIYYVSWAIVGVVFSGIAGLGAYLTTKDLGTTLGFVTSFLNIFSFSFYLLFLVSVALQYFSMVESKDGTGILNRLNTIGHKKADHEDIEEQY